MELGKLFSTDLFQSLVRAFMILGIGLPLLHFVSRSVGAYAQKRTSEHIGLMTRKVIFITGDKHQTE